MEQDQNLQIYSIINFVSNLKGLFWHILYFFKHLLCYLGEGLYHLLGGLYGKSIVLMTYLGGFIWVIFKWTFSGFSMIIYGARYPLYGAVAINVVYWIILVIFLVVTIGQGFSKAPKTIKMGYIGTISVLLPFLLLQLEVSIQKRAPLAKKIGFSYIINENNLINEQNYIMNTTSNLKNTFYNNWEDSSIWIDPNGIQYDLKQELSQNNSNQKFLLVVETLPNLYTEDTIQEFIQKNKQNYKSFYVDQKEAISFPKKALKLDSFPFLKFKILQEWLVSEFKKSSANIQNIIIIKGDEEIIRHSDEIQIMINYLHKKINSLNLIILATSSKTTSYLQKLNLNPKPKKIVFYQRRYNETVQLFSQILEKQMRLEKRQSNFQESQRSIRQFVTKLGTNLVYFKEFIENGFLKNEQIKDFIKKKLKDIEYIFAFLKKDTESFDYLKKIVTEIKDNNSSDKEKINRWVNVSEISNIYKTSRQSKSPSEVLNVLVSGGVLVKKNAAVRFLSNEVYYAFLQFLGENR